MTSSQKHLLGSAAVAIAGFCHAAQDQYRIVALAEGVGGNHPVSYRSDVSADVWLTLPNTSYTVTVSNGWASPASATNGGVVAISANPPVEAMQFDRWIGDTDTVSDVFASSTTLVMPSADVAVTATYSSIGSYYVDASRPDDTGDGRSWRTAKKTIQAAVDLAANGDIVLVNNGVYNTGARPTPGYTLNNRLVITNAVTVRSVNGPTVTVIEGSGTNAFNTSSAVRCVYMKRGVLEGFTLGKGTTCESGLANSDPYERCGGGVNMSGALTGTAVSNCVISGCYATFGGGAYSGTLIACTLSGNVATSSGGGSYYGTQSICMFSGNTAIVGGGAHSGTQNVCTLTGNKATSYGGGAYGSTLNSCALMGNTATSNGGGAYRGALNNCTLTGNTATFGAGGASLCTLNNCIVWDNKKDDGTLNNYLSATFYYSCTAPMPSSGSGNIDADPQLVDRFNPRLRTGSPCVDAGSNVYVKTATDLAGNPRIQNGTVDMGACEGTVTAVSFPAFSLPSGSSITNAAELLISCATEGASIYYTLDGSEPTDASPIFGGAILLNGSHSLNGSITVRAKAVKDGLVPAQSMASYRFLETVAPTVFSPVSGSVATNEIGVTLSSATQEAGIRYTLDGSEPTSASQRYTNMITLRQSTTIRAKAIKWGMADSDVTAATYTIYHTLPTLAEALDATNLVVTTGGDTNWFVQAAVTHDGLDAAQSGVLTDQQSTWIETALAGPGTLSFWWKVSCEDDSDADDRDYLAVFVDGAEVFRIDGVTEWRLKTLALGSGAHVIRWAYCKNDILSGGEDCAWVDELKYYSGLVGQTVTTPVPVPYLWLDRYPLLLSLAGGDYEAAAFADVDGDGHTAWQEYVTGSLPTDRESVLRTILTASNDHPQVTWAPDMGTARVYAVEGKANLSEAAWGPTNAGSRFFRVRADMPK